MTDAVQKTKARIKEILSGRSSERSARQAEVSKARQRVDEAQKRMDAAMLASDAEAYSKAKAERGAALDAVEMHEKRLHALEDIPLVTRQEYKTTVTEIMRYLQEANDDHRKKALKLVEELENLKKENERILNEGNDVLKQWQHTINKDADREKYGPNQVMLRDSELHFTGNWFCNMLYGLDITKENIRKG